MAAHLKEDTCLHLTLLAQAHQELAQAHQELARQNQELMVKLLEEGEQMRRETEGNRREMEASTVEIQMLKDRILTLERRAITKAEHQKLSHGVATKKDLDDRVGGLEQKQDTTMECLDALRRHLHVAPLEIFMTDFEQHKRMGQWYSKGFYTHPQGYKMCLRVDASWDGPNRYLSCYVYLMRGVFDSHVYWPFQGDVTIQLLNQQEDANHRTTIISFDDKTPGRCTRQVASGERAAAECGFGYTKFILLSNLGYNHATKCQYLLDDRLYFRVTCTLTDYD